MLKILLPTDGSKDALEAAKFLSRLPHGEPFELSVVTVIAHPELHPADTSGSWPSEYWDQLNRSAQETLDQITPMFEGADVTLTQKILVGHAAHQIVKEAGDSDADLIVLGAKGHTAIGRILLGSVSDDVATHAACSVLVVRAGSEHSEGKPYCVTIGYDGSQRSEAALHQFSQFNWGPTTRANVLTVVPIVRFFGKDVLPETLLRRTEQHEIAAQATAQATQRIAPSGADVGSAVIEMEHVGEAIVSFANERGSDLVVVGDTGLSGISRMLLGSVSRYVLRHADCSVWIARTKHRKKLGH